jgi:anti-sigma28 factor (negative regulator of flagellin synthesis)
MELKLAESRAIVLVREDTMQINGVGGAGAAWSVGANRPPAAPEPAAKAQSVMSPKDEVEISSLGQMLDDASRTGAMREQRLAQIKSAIEAGTYETPEKLEAAVSRLLDGVNLDELR